MARIRVDGKVSGSNPEFDYVSRLQEVFGLKRSTVMSYWKDAVKMFPGTNDRKLYLEVHKAIEDDQNS